jgi:hypothetical protein
MVAKPYTQRAGASNEYATLSGLDASGEGQACLSILQRSTLEVVRSESWDPGLGGQR